LGWSVWHRRVRIVEPQKKSQTACATFFKRRIVSTRLKSLNDVSHELLCAHALKSLEVVKLGVAGETDGVQ